MTVLALKTDIHFLAKKDKIFEPASTKKINKTSLAKFTSEWVQLDAKLKVVKS